MNKKLFAGTIAVLVGIGTAAIAGNLSKYATHATSSAVNFPASDGATIIKTLHVESDKAGSLAKVYARTGDAETVTAAAAASATTIEVANTDGQFAVNDLVIYQHASGALLYTTISTSNAASVVLATGITPAGTLSDKLYEVSLQGQFDVAAATVTYTGDVFATPNDSPLRIVVDSTSAGYLTATVETDK